MINLKTLEELRTKKELINYFKQLGKEITEYELNKLKQSYDQAQESSNALTLEQLDDIAGGGSIVRVFIQPKGYDYFSHEYCLLITANGENSLSHGNHKIAIQVIQNYDEIEVCRFLVSFPVTSDYTPRWIDLTGKQFQEHFGKDFVGAMHDAYGELTPESLPSRKKESVPDKCSTTIPIGSLSHAIDGLNNLLTYNSEGFNFNDAYQKRLSHGETFEENLAAVKADAIVGYVNNYIMTHIDVLTEHKLLKHLRAVGAKDNFFSKIIKEKHLDDISLLASKLENFRQSKINSQIEVYTNHLLSRGAREFSTYTEFIINIDKLVWLLHMPKEMADVFKKNDYVELFYKYQTDFAHRD